MSTLSFNKSLYICLIVWSGSYLTSHCAPSLHNLSEQNETIGVKLYDGVPALRDEFPYLVSIRVNGDDSFNEHLCGGTLVDMSTVITAAHCVDGYRMDDLSIAAGAYLLSEARLGIQQSRRISKISYHPNFLPANSNQHDIVVIELTNPFEENTSVKALRMASPTQETSGRCHIVGWGHTAHSDKLSEVLMKGLLSVNDKRVCVSNYPAFDTNHQLCIGGMDGSNVSPCWGDTGGPTICTAGDGSRYFAGVMSWGRTCGSQGWPTVCMEISKYRNWINSVITQRSTTTTTRRPNLPDSLKNTDMNVLSDPIRISLN